MLDIIYKEKLDFNNAYLFVSVLKINKKSITYKDFNCMVNLELN